MEFVIFKTGGKQYKAKVGDIIEVDKLPGDTNKKVELSDVLLWVSDGKTKIGKPTIDGASVNALILEQKKGEKIRVAKFKAKARYRKVIGFRALRTKLQVESISVAGSSTKKVAEVKTPRTKTAAKNK